MIPTTTKNDDPHSNKKCSKNSRYSFVGGGFLLILAILQFLLYNQFIPAPPGIIKIPRSESALKMDPDHNKDPSFFNRPLSLSRIFYFFPNLLSGSDYCTEWQFANGDDDGENAAHFLEYLVSLASALITFLFSMDNKFRADQERESILGRGVI
jgi:hypothetical protein